ncbi:MAG: hypothetical protein GY936_08830 [Ignavibacteriae bacterium]|nr:hypothetical protein [Ignavibacteriota bacterium]
MNTDNKLLLEFEKEIWLYIDKDLSEERIQFWTNAISKNIELQNLLESTNSITDLYNEVSDYNLGNEIFDKIIDKAIGKKGLLFKIKNYFLHLLDQGEEHLFGKVAFASFLIICAIVVSLVSNKPNSVKSVTNVVKSEILEWDPETVDNQIKKIETLLLLAKNDKYKKYYINKIASNQWDRNTYGIENRIEKIKNDLGNNEF